MYNLSGQVIRNGEGDRWSAFLFINADISILFVFRLAGGEKERMFKLKGLEMDINYSIHYQDSGCCIESTGRELVEKGLMFNSLEEEASEIIIIKRERSTTCQAGM